MFVTLLGSTGNHYQIPGDPHYSRLFSPTLHQKSFWDVQRDDGQQAAVSNSVLRDHGVFNSPGKKYPSLFLSKDDLYLTKEAMVQAAKAVVDKV